MSLFCYNCYAGIPADYHFMFSIQRRIRKIQPVARYHDSIGIDVHTHGAPS